MPWFTSIINVWDYDGEVCSLIIICCILRSYTCRSIDEYSPDEGGGSFEVVALLKSIGNFIGIFIGSFILGTLMGLLTALV